jgi:hypothetical protein
VKASKWDKNEIRLLKSRETRLQKAVKDDCLMANKKTTNNQ